MQHHASTESDGFRNIVSTAGEDDRLALFEAEAVRAEAAVAPPALAQADEHSPARAQGEHPLSLDQMLDCLRFVSWSEAVAIVDVLCAELTAGGADARVPELSQIALTSAGTVVVAGGAPTGAPGPRLARILHSLTGHGAVPAPLRLFVSKWVAFEEAHSIVDFAKELAYFVRPEPKALIQDVYGRAVAAMSRGTLQAPDATAETTKPGERTTGRRIWPPSRRMVVAVALVGASLASVLAWRAASTPSGAVSANLSDVWSRGGQAASQMVSAVRQLAGLGVASPGAADPASSPAASAAQAAAPASRAARGASAGRATAPGPGVAAASGPGGAGPGSGESSKSVGISVPPSLTLSVPAPVQSPPGGVEELTALPPTYSSADADVTPPQMLYPQLPPPLLGGVRAEVNTIELIVTEGGTVERVRMLSAPRRMADMMLLSGAKTWQFAPASRDGQSVRYRLLLSWDATP